MNEGVTILDGLNDTGKISAYFEDGRFRAKVLVEIQCWKSARERGAILGWRDRPFWG